MNLKEAFDVQFTFRERPTLLPADVHTEWRVGLLLLCLKACRGDSATLPQWAVLDWATRYDDAAQHLVQYLEGRRAPLLTVVRFDPSFDRAVRMCTALRLVHTRVLVDRSMRFELLERGSVAAAMLLQDEDVYEKERKFLFKSLGRKLTASDASGLFPAEMVT